MKGTLAGMRQFLVTESPFKMMKNAFYFTLKVLFVLKIFRFFVLTFGHVEKQLDQKDKVNFKICDVTNLKQTIAIHVLPNISRSKSNQTMIFGQLIEYKMRNIFLENHTQNVMKKQTPFPKSYLKKIKIERICGSIVQSFIQLNLIVCQFEGYRNLLKLSCRPLAFT